MIVSSNSPRPSPGFRGNIERRGVGLAQPPQLAGIEQVALVVHVQALDVACADLVENRTHRGHVPLALGAGRIDDVQHEIGLAHFLECGAEGRHERVRQALDEADRVRDEQLTAVRQAHAADERDRA